MFKSLLAAVALTIGLAGDHIPARAGVWRWNMRNRISKAIVTIATALSLAVSALATAGPAAAQWRGERDDRWWGPMSTGAPWSPPFARGERAPFWNDDSCWQVRPIYSISGAWLDNRRVNVCR
jgi:hypothetical protein